MAAAMTCAESEELLALAALGELSRAEAAPLDAHLGLCAACRETAAGYVRTVSAMAGGLPAAEPPPTLRRSLLRSAYGDVPAPVAEAPRWSRPRPRPRRRFVLGIAGACVTVAAVVLALVAVTRPGPAAPPSRTYTVVGSTTDPTVQGTLTYYSEPQQSVLTVTGLPAPGDGDGAPSVYELWVIRDDGAAQGIAFLAPSPVDRSWTAVIHADLSRYVAVAATTEPAGGSLQPTGAQVFSVQVTR